MKPPILLIHGAFGNANHFAAWVDFLGQRGFNCVAPDLPGHSALDAERLGTLTIDDYLVALRDEIVRFSSPPIVIGHSMGGLLAQQLAALHPCRALVCVASAPPWMLRPQFAALPFLIPMLPAIVRGQPILPSESAFRYLLLNDLSREERELLLPTLGGESGRVFRAMLFGLARLPGSRFAGPVLCLSGAGDRIISQATSRAIAHEYGADHKVFDAGHWLIAASAATRIAGHALEWIERRL
jgi:pimeloyl-ACP methyl ester carboxylesterase